MDGFVVDFIIVLTAEAGCQPTYGQYSQRMTGLYPRAASVPTLDEVEDELPGRSDSDWSYLGSSDTFDRAIADFASTMRPE